MPNKFQRLARRWRSQLNNHVSIYGTTRWSKIWSKRIS